MKTPSLHSSSSQAQLCSFIPNSSISCSPKRWKGNGKWRVYSRSVTGPLCCSFLLTFSPGFSKCPPQGLQSFRINLRQHGVFHRLWISPLAWGPPWTAVWIPAVVWSSPWAAGEYLLQRLECLFPSFFWPWCLHCCSSLFFSSPPACVWHFLPFFKDAFPKAPPFGCGAQLCPVVDWLELAGTAVSCSEQPWLLLTETALQPPTNTWALTLYQCPVKTWNSTSYSSNIHDFTLGKVL